MGARWERFRIQATRPEYRVGWSAAWGLVAVIGLTSTYFLFSQIHPKSSVAWTIGFVLAAVATILAMYLIFAPLMHWFPHHLKRDDEPMTKPKKKGGRYTSPKGSPGRGGGVGGGEAGGGPAGGGGGGASPKGEGGPGGVGGLASGGGGGGVGKKKGGPGGHGGSGYVVIKAFTPTLPNVRLELVAAVVSARPSWSVWWVQLRVTNHGAPTVLTDWTAAATVGTETRPGRHSFGEALLEQMKHVGKLDDETGQTPFQGERAGWVPFTTGFLRSVAVDALETGQPVKITVSVQDDHGQQSSASLDVLKLSRDETIQDF